jgi:hypothetical protein
MKASSDPVQSCQRLEIWKTKRVECGKSYYFQGKVLILKFKVIFCWHQREPYMAKGKSLSKTALSSVYCLPCPHMPEQLSQEEQTEPSGVRPPFLWFPHPT